MTLYFTLNHTQPHSTSHSTSCVPTPHTHRSTVLQYFPRHYHHFVISTPQLPNQHYTESTPNQHYTESTLNQTTLHRINTTIPSPSNPDHPTSIARMSQPLQRSPPPMQRHPSLAPHPPKLPRSCSGRGIGLKAKPDQPVPQSLARETRQPRPVLAICGIDIFPSVSVPMVVSASVSVTVPVPMPVPVLMLMPTYAILHPLPTRRSPTQPCPSHPYSTAQ